jgi:uncharacterized protein YacL
MAGRAVRWTLAAAGAVVGFYVGLSWLGRLSLTYPLPLAAQQALGLLGAVTLAGAAFGYGVGPEAARACRGWLRSAEQRLARTPGVDVLAGTCGGILGLVVSYLLTPVLGRLPWPARGAAALLLGYLGAAVFVRKREDWLHLWAGGGQRRPAGEGAGPAAPVPDGRPKILDTSAIIDGRIADLYGTGFLEGRLVVPTYVLDELRHMADSGDDQRRQRGRFGLDVLSHLQKDLGAPVVLESRDPDPAAEVDTKLVLLARELGGYVVTTDFNLKKVAELQGVAVLNVNALANALRPRYLHGEEMVVRISGPGKQPGQGIGYLEDGTMVVVEGGRRYINQEVHIVVTSSIQNAQGRMVFGRLRAEPSTS